MKFWTSTRRNGNFPDLLGAISAQIQKIQALHFGTGCALKRNMKIEIKNVLNHNPRGVTMKRIIPFLLPLLLVAFGCTKNPVSDSLTTNHGALLFKAGSIPSNVSRIEVTLTNTSTEEESYYEVYDGMTIELPVGEYDILAEAIDQNDLVIYRGEATVQVKEEKTSAVTLYMNLLTGEISFEFVWGTGPA